MVNTSDVSFRGYRMFAQTRWGLQSGDQLLQLRVGTTVRVNTVHELFEDESVFGGAYLFGIK